MTAEIEPLDASELRKLVIQLRAFVDQGEFTPTEDESLLERVFTTEQLDSIEEHHERLYTALTRIEEDYAKVVEASGHLEASQDAADALVIIAGLEAEAQSDDADADHASQGDADEENDPDADLDEE